MAQTTDEQRRGTLPASPWAFRADKPQTNSVQNAAQQTFVKQPRANKPSTPLQMGQSQALGNPQGRSVNESLESRQSLNLIPDGPNFGPLPEEIPASTPFLLPPVPTKPTYPTNTGERPSNIDLQPAYPDANEFTMGTNPGRETRSGDSTPRWETIPKNGLVLVGDPRVAPSTNGLPDRVGSWNQVSPTNPSPGSNFDWQSESFRLASEQKQRLSSQVSDDILRDSNVPLDARPNAIEPPVGWQAIEKELKQHLGECDECLRRGAVFSGKQEASKAIRLLLRSLDQRRSNWTSEPYFDQALIAFREEAEFHASAHNAERTQNVESIVQGHQTPVLKGTSLTSVPPAIAAQHYQHFAKDRLIAAAESHPWASDLYYAFGKCLEKQAEEAVADRGMLLGQAAACYQAALATRPGHSEAANQLGFVLLQLDRSQEAQVYLDHSIQIQPTIQGYKNLAELHRRRGDTAGQNWAINQVAALQVNAPSRTDLPSLREVDPKTFANLSPYNAWTNPVSGQNLGTPTPVQAQKPSGSSWFGKLFR